MNTLKSHNRNYSLARVFLYLTVCSLYDAPLSLAWCQEAHEYKPELQKVVYRSNVPAIIRRTTQKVGPTRFFGSFLLRAKTFAIHFYDTSRVRPRHGDFERDSRLDVYQLTVSTTWQKIQTFAVTRRVDANARRDRLSVEAHALWLDPSRQTIPMVYLKIMGHEDRESIPVGNRTDIYGLLFNKPNPKAFLSLHGYVPYSNSTVTLSKLSHPDAKGELTILAVTSDPSQNSYAAYGWADERWKTVGVSTSENGYETALVWNGSKFVPLSDKDDTP